MAARCLVVLVAGWVAIGSSSLPAASVSSATESIRDVTTALHEAEKATARNAYATAVGFYRRASELVPSDAEIAYRLGVALARALEVEAARDVFSDVVRMDPRHAEALYMLARYARKFGDDLPEAVRRYRAVLAVDPRHLQARVELGDVLFSANDLPEAEEMFAFVLREKPNDPKALLGLARIRERQQRYEETLRLLDTVRSLTDPQAEVASLRGRCLKRLGRNEEAQKEFERLRSLAGEDNALSKIRREAHENPGEPERWFRYGLMAYKFRRLNEAGEAFEECVKLMPDRGEVHSLLGIIHLAKRRPDRALVHVRKAIEFLPERGEEYNNLGICLLHEKRYADAIEAFETAIRLGEDTPQVRRNLQTARRLAAQREEAATPESRP